MRRDVAALLGAARLVALRRPVGDGLRHRGSHFATFPPKLVEPCIKAGCPEDGTVLDPFGGAGTVGLVADRLGRDAILIELNEEYARMARKRIYDDCPLFVTAEVEGGNGL